MDGWDGWDSRWNAEPFKIEFHWGPIPTDGLCFGPFWDYLRLKPPSYLTLPVLVLHPIIV